jgi:hypothetical protein
MGNTVPTGGAFLNADTVLGALLTIDPAHYEIHEGDGWGFYKTVSLNAAASAYLSFYSATGVYPHIRVVGAMSNAPNCFLYYMKGTSASATNRTKNKTQGAAVTIYNRNLSITATAPCAVRYTATKLTGTFTAFECYSFGGSTTTGEHISGRGGGGATDTDEWILDDAVSYQIKVLNGAATAVVNLRFFFYE